MESLVGVTLGTGIGGGYIERGRLMRGASGSAFELGHTTINFEGRTCACVIGVALRPTLLVLISRHELEMH